MSALQKLIALERKTKTIGFDWPNIDTIIDQATSECKEIRQTIELKEGQERLQEEIGDLLHAAVSLCVFMNMDVEQTLAQVNKKFGARLDALQQVAAQRGYTCLKGQPFDFLLELWEEAKRRTGKAAQALQPEIRLLELQDIPQIVDCFVACDWPKPAVTFEGYFQEQLRSERLMWVALVEGNFAGYVTLKWLSSYQPFKEKNIPEIKDLNVLPSFRNQGIGSKLMDIAENVAKEKGACVGIGVGLYDGYGEAQKLYVKRDYIPDGRGISYHNTPVAAGSSVCVDDGLILWLTKEFA